MKLRTLCMCALILDLLHVPFSVCDPDIDINIILPPDETEGNTLSDDDDDDNTPVGLTLPPPPKEADIEYVIKLVERKQWEWRTHKALEDTSHCLYSYYDVVFRVLNDTTCVAYLQSGRSIWEDPWTTIDDDDQSGNQTSKHPYPCQPRAVPENITSGVQVVNASECLRLLSQDQETDKEGVSILHCAVVLFYSESCRFSVQVAPSFNALGRALPGVDVLAVDVSQSNGLYTRYGIVAIPDVLLFHHGKPVLRFNYTERTFENLVTFLHNNTGLEASTDVQVSTEDFEGPLPTTRVIRPDYFLWFSNAFVILFALYILKKRLGESVLQRIREYMDYARQVWRTGEFYEQVGVHDNEDAGFG